MFLGEHNRDVNDTTEMVHDIEQIKMHPYYNDVPGEGTLEFDVAVMKLKSSIIYNDYVQPICFPQGGVVDDTTSCFVSGWGRTSINGSGWDTLQQAELPIIGKCIL